MTELVERGVWPESERLSLWAQVSIQSGPFLSMLDSSIVNVAINNIASDLHASIGAVSWTISAYLLALGAFLPASAWLAKRYGLRRIYLISVIGFGLTSIGCAAAPSIGTLIAFRALQGMVSAPLVPLALSLIFTGTNRYQMPLALNLSLFLAPALGPAVGGLLVSAWSWRAIFLINAPVVVLGVIGAMRLPDRQFQRPPKGSFDGVGLALLVVGMTSLTYGAYEISSSGSGTAVAWTTLVVGVLMIGGYLAWARRVTHPVVRLNSLASQRQLLGLGCYTVASIVLWAMLFLVPVYVQQAQGHSAITAGLVLMPQGIVMGLAAPLGEKLVRSGRLRLTVTVGMIVLAATTAGLLAVRLTTPPWLLSLIVGGRGIALALTVQPLIAGLLGDQDATELADASTVFTVSQRIGGSVGIGAVAAFYTARISSGHAFTDTAWLLIILALLGAVLATGLPRRSIPASSLQQMKQAGRNPLTEGQNDNGN
jgi:EmrB/QacA subfamily drug resistance transporter